MLRVYPVLAPNPAVVSYPVELLVRVPNLEKMLAEVRSLEQVTLEGSLLHITLHRNKSKEIQRVRSPKAPQEKNVYRNRLQSAPLSLNDRAGSTSRKSLAHHSSHWFEV